MGVRLPPRLVRAGGLTRARELAPAGPVSTLFTDDGELPASALLRGGPPLAAEDDVLEINDALELEDLLCGVELEDFRCGFGVCKYTS